MRPDLLPTFCTILLAAAITAPGCQSGSSSSFDRYSIRGDADEKFAKGADRPPTVHTLHAMARLLAAQGQDAQCAAVLSTLLKDHPKFLPAHVDLAELYMRTEQVDKAITALGEARKLAPEDPVLLNNLGMCRMMKSQYDVALDLFIAAVDLAPRNTRYRANAATALGMLGKYDQALKAYEQMLGPAQAHYNLAVLCEARSDPDRAALEFARARSLGFLAPRSVSP